jgi:transcriptional regulator
MYNPPAFQEHDTDELFRFMRTWPLGLLVSSDGHNLSASALPFFSAPGEGEHGVLRAHIAKKNEHWPALQHVEECLVVFQGPDAYVAPSWYPGKAVAHKAVPTWNYAMVQVWGKPAIIESDRDWLLKLVAEITRAEEHRRARPWTPDDAPAEYLETLLPAIVGLEVSIRRIEGKWKMSQNRDAGDIAGVINGMRDPKDPHHNEAVAAINEARTAAAR